VEALPASREFLYKELAKDVLADLSTVVQNCPRQTQLRQGQRIFVREIAATGAIS
jgi:hypothetical protein